MNKITLRGFFEETEKLADAGLGMEALGVPGALAEGWKKNKWKGVAGVGLGAAGGLGAGLLARHLVHQNFTGGAWGKEHPVMKLIAENAPLALGGTVGGALGEHYSGRPRIKSASAAAELLEKVVKRTPLIYSEQKKIEELPERYRKAMQALDQTIPMGLAFPVQ